MNLNRLRLGQKSRKKNYKIKPCQNDIIKCNCDNLHTFIHILYYVLCKITYTFTDVKRNLSTRTGTWTRDLQTAPRTFYGRTYFAVLEIPGRNSIEPWHIEDTSDEWSLRISILHSSSQKAFDSSKTINIQFNQDFLYFVVALVLT